MRWTQGEFTVDTDKATLSVDVIHAYLSGSYWSPCIPRAVVERSITHSICFGLYDGPAQIGFARVVTDQATYAYLADVFVLPDWRGRGLSKFMMSCIRSHPDLQNLKRWALATRDAHSLYAQFGFAAPGRPDFYMEIVDMEVFKMWRQLGESV